MTPGQCAIGRRLDSVRYSAIWSQLRRELYREAFHLNDTELELIAGLVPPGQMLIRKAHGSKKVQLNVDSVSHWMATNNARDNLTKREYFARFGIPEGLRRLAHDFPFRPRTAAGITHPNPEGAVARDLPTTLHSPNRYCNVRRRGTGAGSAYRPGPFAGHCPIHAKLKIHDPDRGPGHGKDHGGRHRR